jgi:hypothetical protein
MWILHRTVKFCWRFGMQFAGNFQANWQLFHHDSATPHTTRETHERIQELQLGLFEHQSYSLDLAASDLHLFGPLTNTLVASVSLMTKRLKRRCGSGWENSQNTSMLLVLTHRQSDGTRVSMLVEDMSRKFFFRFEYHVLRFTSICDLFTDSPSYYLTAYIFKNKIHMSCLRIMKLKN